MTSQVRGVQLARLLGQWHALPGRRRSPDYAALAAAVRGLLADGRLPLGVRLPAERELAEALRISRTTVTAAYRELRESGHLASRRGAGSWTMLPGGHRVASTGLWTPLDDRDMIDLGVAALSAPPQLVPAARAAAEDLPRYLGGAGYHPTGIIELREAVARAYTERGLPTSPEQIMVTSGTQHALDLVLRLALSPGGAVLVESPTYPNALAALSARRARIATHGLSDEGWDAELLLGSLRQTRPKLAYVIPEFQNPTGHLMAADLRERLVGTAHAAGTDLVVDESFVDLPLDDTTLPPPVAVFDRHSRVISIGGMSKPYWGGLRIGWVRASAPQVQRLAAARVGVDMASPVLDQLVAVHLLTEAPAIVAARRAQLVAQRDALVTALADRLPDWRVRVPSGGVTLWAELDGPISSALARAAEEVGVRLAPGPRFGLDGTLERFLRLPFTLPADELVEAVGRLAAVRYDLDRTSRPQWREPSVIA
ncbi:PLP-dependent aminotransferase family protein [Micromonospora sp. C28ISP2-4]|uniref:MocR-like transcription factor YczR n=1 Tax=Micromonospora sp. C28ISP2-4 TaxID=3059523 RepID=UPI002676203B|nr:PLP-dependent aminotransferase family protein [Micromonospora sp. C28ISP2-4]MDO3687088.1 PLP-dependent aminotransferase family protein [Micromonospora sp. C28ISP2-4]